MDISFTGIKNIKIIQKHVPDRVILSLNESGNIETSVADYKNLALSCNLTDDYNGKHLQELHNIIGKLRDGNLYDHKDYTHVNVGLDTYTVVDRENGMITKFGQHMFNGNNISLSEPSDRKFLELYTFIAKLIRESVISGNFFAKDKDNLIRLSQSIHDNATNFIENIM